MLDGILAGVLLDGDHFAVGFAVLVVAIFDSQCDAGHYNSDEDDNKYATNVPDADAVALPLAVVTRHAGGVLVPPGFLEALQAALV